MKKALGLALLGLTLAANPGMALAGSNGKHLMWITTYKSTPYAAWHDNATCPNRPDR